MQNICMWLARAWSPAVTALSRSFPAVLLTGPRQVGKTSLLRHELPRASYLTFDDVALARQAEDSPDAFFDGAPREPLILDEVQYVPSLFRHLKRRIDQRPEPGRFLLTGSQTFPLMQNVSESLAGRCGVLEMSSLSFREVRRQLDIGDGEFLVAGGFPALHAGGAPPRGDWYASYLATYLERDVRNLKSIGNLRDFDRFLRALAIRTGQLLSYSDLARDVGIAPNTARSWISVLEASRQIFLLEPYHRSLGKRLVKSPKVYFMDTGLACWLVGLDSPRAWLASPLAGALWETFVVTQVVRHFQVTRARLPLWFWRTANGEEVDLLVERGGRFLAVECKLGESPGADALRGFDALERFYQGPVIEKGFIACRATRPWPFKQDRRMHTVGVLDLIKALPRSS